MKIRTKLTLLTSSMVISIVISIASLLINQYFIDRLSVEQDELSLLNVQMQENRIVLLHFITNDTPLQKQMDIFKNSIEVSNATLFRVIKLNMLPVLSKETGEAMLRIGRITGLLKASQSSFDEALLYLSNEIINIDEQFSIKNKDLYKSYSNYKKILFGISRVKSLSNIIDGAITSAIKIITTQEKIITKYIIRRKNISKITTLAITLFAVFLSVTIALLISNNISQSIKLLHKSLSIMVKGDFTNDIHIKTTDELGLLGKEINSFQVDLNKSLNKIKDSSRTNENANIRLIETTADSSTVSVEISENIDSINNQMTKLDNNITKSNIEANEVLESTKILNGYTSEQMAMVEESSASITQMIASISSISELTDNNSKIIKILEVTANEGDEKLMATIDLIDEINSRVNEINNISELIKSISDQTNLLAMNAAIEAAHAGDAGKGFAVVADEIRKLAEASNLNSQDISKNLKDITKKFEIASISGQSTREAFSNINNNIKSVSNGLLVVASSTSELNTGGAQILEAMEHLKEISMSVQDKAYNMKTKAQNITLISSDVSDISQNVKSAISEANIGFTDVTNSMTNLKGISVSLSEVSNEINHELEKFKTDYY